MRLPHVPGKAVAVDPAVPARPPSCGKSSPIGWSRVSPATGLLYFNFEDERLAEMAVRDLQWVLEEYYALCRSGATGGRPCSSWTKSR